MSASVTVWLIDLFPLVFGQQGRSIAQRKRIYQDIHRQYLLVVSFLSKVSEFKLKKVDATGKGRKEGRKEGK